MAGEERGLVALAHVDFVLALRPEAHGAPQPNAGGSRPVEADIREAATARAGPMRIDAGKVRPFRLRPVRTGVPEHGIAEVGPHPFAESAAASRPPAPSIRRARPPVRLVLDGGRVVREERYLHELGRVRDVRQGPDGLLYVLTDGEGGRLLRLDPAG